jgi:hypothetical protein
LDNGFKAISFICGMLVDESNNNRIIDVNGNKNKLAIDLVDDLGFAKGVR